MTPKDKADDLMAFYRQYIIGETKEAKKYASKQCAFKTVDVILQALNEYDSNTESEIKDFQSFQEQNMERDWNYWENVKREIKLF